MQWSHQWSLYIPNRWKIVGRTYLKGLFDFVAGLMMHLDFCEPAVKEFLNHPKEFH